MKFRFITIALLALSMSACKDDSDDTVNVPYPTDGLVSYFNFDYNLTDQRGNTGAGSNLGAFFFDTGVNKNAIEFDGVDDRISFPRKSFKNGNNISVALWFKNNDTLAGQKLFVECSDFGLFTAGTLCGIVISTPQPENAFATFVPDVWTHLVGTYDGTTIKLFINSVLIDSKPYAGNITDLDIPLQVGNGYNGFWKGSVDDLFIYNKVLSQEEVNQLYNL